MENILGLSFIHLIHLPEKLNRVFLFMYEDFFSYFLALASGIVASEGDG